jgi:hypothetical protein
LHWNRLWRVQAARGLISACVAKPRARSLHRLRLYNPAWQAPC